MPKFSVFTPTHDTKYLKRAATSLAEQTNKDFEWIILPNGEASISDIESLPNARIIESTKPDSKNIGLFKKECCKAATGDILVEFDHDDELTPNCLEELSIAFDDKSVDFCYSNDADVTPEMKAHQYSSRYGWEYRPFTYKGLELQEQLSFPPTAASFSKIWFAPNHVRAWRKTFYERIGGHDEKLDILDDQDVLSRTYILGNVRHIDKCLYIYYRHADNTCYGEKNKFIQTETLNIHDKYIYQLAEKWADLNNLLKIDLCGGHNSPKGYISVDLHDSKIRHDLNTKWPFADGSIGLLRAHDALEHLKDPLHVMKEAYRTIAPMGWFLTLTPSTDGRGAFQDPTHISFWNSNSFWYYTKSETAKYIGSPVRFQGNRIKNFFPNEYCKTHNIAYVKADLIRLPDRDSGVRVPGEVLI